MTTPKAFELTVTTRAPRRSAAALLMITTALTIVVAAPGGAEAAAKHPQTSASHKQSSTDARIARLQAALEAQQRALAAQQEQILALQKLLGEVQHTAENTNRRSPYAVRAGDYPVAYLSPLQHQKAIQSARQAAGVAASGASGAPPVFANAESNADAYEPTGATTTRETVGEKPKDDKQQIPDLPAIADSGGVLTPKHVMTLEPSVTASHSSSNRFLVRGTQIVPGVLLGDIAINDVQHDYASAALAARYGITDRLEASVNVPYVYRHDIFNQDSLTNTNGIAQNGTVDGHGIGDVDFGVQYQLNKGANGEPIITANLRAKAPTGEDPFGVPYDSRGNPTRLATGSGFWGIQPSITIIKTMDPLVFYGSLSYLANMARDVNKVLTSTNGNPVKLGVADPGDAVGLSFGGAFAITDNVSVSLGYEHYYVLKGSSEFQSIDTGTGALGPTQRSISGTSQVGSLLFGTNIRTSSGGSYNLTLAAGLTKDAPEVQFTIRRPFSFSLAR